VILLAVLARVYTMKKLLGIPAHNEEKYLAHTLSLLSQNHIYKLFDELVIIDDASTDKTLQQAYKQLKKHRPLRNKTSFIIHSKNLGK
jgi:glycosyltransferase involved in cell wall biosynthesis